jgi:hypothetical protein
MGTNYFGLIDPSPRQPKVELPAGVANEKRENTQTAIKHGFRY